MKTRKKKSFGIRFLNAICFIAILCSGIYLLTAGLQAIAIAVAVIAMAGVATPAVIAGDGILDALLGIFEALFDGVLAISEAIGELFSDL